MTKVKVNGMEFQLCKKLTPREADCIDASLKLHQKILFTIFGDVDLCRTEVEGIRGGDTVTLVKNRRGKWLGIRRASGSVRWDG